ncbi:LysR family transcriptional regulator [Derxia gummosa]|uniref:LysR family transcriptional regulator n=1 Tax=Derxia gummosa DSM 723 TaxID=1121388 RepID=A0A8B6X7E9_9BURK|nr:LysR family transcriptional regulator [Derxia gummosa]
MVDLDSLAALDAVVRHGGVARAAEKLNRVQSAVSYQVRKLEEQLGVALLDRDGYRLRLTPAGEALLAEGRRLLLHAEQFGALARSFTEGWEPKLMLVADGILPLDRVFSALKTLADERVPTRVQVKVEFLYGVQYRFEKERADLMIVKDYEPDPLLVAEPLPAIECVLCAAPDHALAGAAEVDLPELQEHVELTVQDSSERGDDRHMFGGERVFYLSGFTAKKQALHMGLGFGWMPMHLVADDLEQGALFEVRYRGGSRYRFTPVLVHRRDMPPGRAGRRLAELLRA